MAEKIKAHWPEYLIEAVLLGSFMLSACFFTALLEHPSSPLASLPISAMMRRITIGCAMGLTAIFLIYSPWGRRSGAHMNPSVTLTFYRLGKVSRADALFYVAAQFLGAGLALLVVAAVFHGVVSDPSVSYVQTKPGPSGPLIAFVAEVTISFLLMLVVLSVSNTPKIARWTGICAGILVAAYISVEAPLSGMSMNPARSFASAFAAGNWEAIWIYFAAPPLGMLTAAWLYTRLRGAHTIPCAKLHHVGGDKCIFCEHHRKGLGAA